LSKPWIYYVGIAIFGALSISFSFGDIENSKNLQIFTSIMRVVILFLIYAGMGFDMSVHGAHEAPIWNWAEQS